MFKRIIKRASWVLATTALLGLSGIANAEEKSKLDEVIARGYVKVGVSSEAPPFGFINDKGELVGFDIDIARLIAKGLFKDPEGFCGTLGQHPKWQNRLWNSGHYRLSRSRIEGCIYAALHRFRNCYRGKKGSGHQQH